MRWGDDNSVGQPRGAIAVVREDRLRDDRGGRVALAAVEHHVDPVGGQHLQSAPSGRFGEGVRVPAQEEWAVDAVRASIQANGLGDGEDVGLVESAGER
jgi:hypothetical protein